MFSVYDIKQKARVLISQKRERRWYSDGLLQVFSSFVAEPGTAWIAMITRSAWICEDGMVGAMNTQPATTFLALIWTTVERRLKATTWFVYRAKTPFTHNRAIIVIVSRM
jgi:hypothetical protein